MEKAQSIFSGLINMAKLVPCSEKETSFVGIYANTSPGKSLIEEGKCLREKDILIENNVWGRYRFIYD